MMNQFRWRLHYKPKDEKEDTPLWKHCLLAHNGVKQSFVMKPLRTINSLLQRQANEVLRITARRAHITMNSKNRWHQAHLGKLGVHPDGAVIKMFQSIFLCVTWISRNVASDEDKN